MCDNSQEVNCSLSFKSCLQVDFLIENQQNHLHFNEKGLVDSVLRSEGELIISQSIVGMG